MANKLNKEYPSITETKNILKMNPNVSVDQVKGYDRRARNNEFIMEHVKIIERLTNENQKLKAEQDDVKEENEKLEKQMQGVQYSKGICDELSKQIKSLNKDLEAAEHTRQHSNSTHQNSYEKLEKENKDLKKEIKDTKQNLDYWMRDAFAKDNLKIKNEKLKEYNSDLHNEIKLLKEQIKDLQEEYEAEVNYEDDEVDYYVDAGRKVVLKDGRIVKSKD